MTLSCKPHQRHVLEKICGSFKGSKKIEKKEEKTRERETRKKEREQIKAADGDSDDEGNDGSWEVVDRTATKVAMFAKDAEITSDLVIKKLAEIMAARGKKKTYRKERLSSSLSWLTLVRNTLLDLAFT